MKRIILSAAAIAALAACNKEGARTLPTDNLNRNAEISINTAVDKSRGYVTGSEFFDTAISQLHEEEPELTERSMKLSAFLTPQTGEAGNYFTDYLYEVGADGDWHHTPAVYWPVAGTLDFLAYSSQKPFDAKDVAWNEKNASESVVLNVLEDRTQDDIVFAFATGKKSADGADAVAMEFQHTQAWLEFRIKVADASMKERIAIKEIIIENAYSRGELTINRTSDPVASWSFRREQSENIIFEDNYGLYGDAGTAPEYAVSNPLDENVSYMDMLLPEQAKTSFIIRYVLAGQDKTLQYRYDLSAGKKNWIMGEKYIYEVTFNISEISVAPSVKEFAEGDVEDLDPSELK